MKSNRQFKNNIINFERKFVKSYKNKVKTGGKNNMNMKRICGRTDLAIESITEVGEGIRQYQRGEAFKITEIEISEDRYGEQFGKKKGRYITLENGNLGFPSEDFRKMAEELAEEIKKLVPGGKILIAGLGNDDITPDALGVATADRIFATRHLKDEFGEKESDENFPKLREVAVISAGVMGKTGIESMEIIKSVCERIGFDGVIAVDALACSDISRLGTTIQISDSGISPGSGVQNRRKELSADTLGIPVIAIGVPTVADMHTIAMNLTGKEPEKDLPNMMVTPRNIDMLTEKTARLLGMSINLALQENMSYEDIEGLA